jgi:hypothetical protein
MSTEQQRREWREDAERRQASKPVGSYGYNDAGVTLTLLADVDRLTAELASTPLAGIATHIDLIHAYAAYYADVASRGDAPETFANWFNGAQP